MHRLCSAVFLATLCFATAAAAGTGLCLFDDDNAYVYRFDKLKLPKQIGATAAFTAAAFPAAPVVLPVAGAVTRLDEDTWVIGFTRYGSNCVVAGEIDASFHGAFSYDCDLDGSFDGDAALIVPIDCNTL